MDAPMRIIDHSAAAVAAEPPPPADGRPAPPRRGRLRHRRPGRAVARFDTGRVAEARHRNPTWLVAGVLLVVLSALGGALLFAAADDRVVVLVAAADLQPGVRLDSSDLRIARVVVDDGVATVGPDGAAALIGQQPVGRVPTGTMLSPGMFADELPLGADEVVVGAALDPGEAPLSGLEVGARVELLALELGDRGGVADRPIAGTGAEATGSPADVLSADPIGTGTVWAVEPIATGQLWVSVRVDRDIGLKASLASALDALRIVLIGGPP